MKNRLSRGRSRSLAAFTLIELLVVIIILAILAAVVIPRVIGRTDDAKIAAATSNVSTFDGEFEKYKLDTGHYPQGDTGMQALVNNVENDPKWNGPYIKGSMPNDPWGHPYLYHSPGEHSPDYDVFSAGADGQPGTADDLGNWNLQK
jgi:general secretion pathway protein G